jgi:hypothetical protein
MQYKHLWANMPPHTVGQLCHNVPPNVLVQMCNQTPWANYATKLPPNTPGQVCHQTSRANLPPVILGKYARRATHMGNHAKTLGHKCNSTPWANKHLTPWGKDATNVVQKRRRTSSADCATKHFGANIYATTNLVVNVPPNVLSRISYQTPWGTKHSGATMPPTTLAQISQQTLWVGANMPPHILGQIHRQTPGALRQVRHQTPQANMPPNLGQICLQT